MAELKTTTEKNVEILRVGTWLSANKGKVTFTRTDLDDMTAGYRATKGKIRVPVKLGHDMLQAVFGDLAGELADGEPAFGWVENIRAVGDKLLADFEDVPAKLAQFLRVKAWRNRSPEILFNYPAAGQRHRRLVTAVSLLGAVPPAVEGMADLYMAGDELPDGAERHHVLLAAGDDTELDQLVSELRALRDRFEPLLKNRRGAPVTRRLFDAFEAQLRRAARTNLTKQESDMKDAVLALLGLDDDAEDGAIRDALKDAEANGAVVRLALGADSALAVISEILGMPGADVEDVVAAVRELAGGPPAEGDGITGNEPPEDANMSKGTDEGDGVAKLSADLADTQKQLADVLAREAATDATKAVDTYIADGKAVPAERETLVKLALADRKSFDAWMATRPEVVKLGERGTSQGKDAADGPSDLEKKIADEMGYSHFDTPANGKAD